MVVATGGGASRDNEYEGLARIIRSEDECIQNAKMLWRMSPDLVHLACLVHSGSDRFCLLDTDELSPRMQYWRVLRNSLPDWDWTDTEMVIESVVAEVIAIMKANEVSHDY